MPLIRERVRHENAGMLARIHIDRRLACNLPLVDERPVQPRRFAIAQNVREQIQRKEGALTLGRNAVADERAGQRHHVANGFTGLADAAYRRGGRAQRPRTGWNLSEPRANQRGGFLDVDITRDHQSRVVGPIKGGVKRGDVLHRRGCDVVHRSDDGMPVWMAREKQFRKLGVIAAVRLIVDALALLLHHHTALRLETFRGEQKLQETVGFQPEAQFELVRRQNHVVIRLVLVRVRIVVPARQLALPVEDAARHIDGPVEHQMLEQVGKPCLARRFVLRADVVRNVYAHDGHEAAAMQHDAQAVPEREFREVDVRHDAVSGGKGRK